MKKHSLSDFKIKNENLTKYALQYGFTVPPRINVEKALSILIILRKRLMIF